MATRSRKGCIDCKRAKVKCDELHPSCGTCARRGRQCAGYDLSRARKASARDRSIVPPVCSRIPDTATDETASMVAITPVSLEGPVSLGSDQSMWPPSEDDHVEDRVLAQGNGATALTQVGDSWDGDASSSAASYLRAVIVEASTKTMSPLGGPTLIPLGEILAADRPFIEVYFMRHPSEMVMRDDGFISEMNRAVISLLQQSPMAVGDSLSAIGEKYVRDVVGSAVVSSRKMRLLSRLRLVNEDGSSPELVLFLILALCGVELVDPSSAGDGNALCSLIENLSMTLAFYVQAGQGISDVAKYFARGVARQDLLLSLSRMQRNKIDPSVWLDQYSARHADRLMGLTTTLAPILAELSALAEDVQYFMDTSLIIDFAGPFEAPVGRTDLQVREASIRAKLLAWQPVRDRSMSMQTMRKLILHANAWRSAALLYLFRLLDRPGSSAEADDEAQALAYEVTVNISGSCEDIKLSLWPLFVAACELDKPEDRAIAVQLFDGIYSARPLATVKRTKAFCVDQIWPARDVGAVWDWMQLSRLESNAFMPL